MPLLAYPVDAGVAYLSLLTAFLLQVALTPMEAGAKTGGAALGAGSHVVDLFRCTVKTVAGEPVAGRGPGAVAYNFKALAGTDQWFARRTDGGIEHFRTTPLAIGNVKAAFSTAVSGARGSATRHD